MNIGLGNKKRQTVNEGVITGRDEWNRNWPMEGWMNGLQRQQWAEGDDALSSRYPRAIEESADYEIQANIESKQASMNSCSPK